MKNKMIGVVAANGGIYFHGDIGECRDFLRARGLECERDGWVGNGQTGVIGFGDSSFYAAAFYDERRAAQ